MAHRRSSRVGSEKITFVQRSRAMSAAAKAEIHQIQGAGRRRVRRPFLGFTADDEAVLARQLEDGIRRSLR